MKTSETLYLLRDYSGAACLGRSLPISIYGCMSFMRAVLNGTDRYLKTKMWSNGKRTKQVSRFGQHLPNLHKYADIFSREFTFHPALAFFFEEFRRHDISCLFFFDRHDEAGNAEIFDDFVMVMRSHAKEMELKTMVNDWESKINKNNNRSHKLVRELFKQNAQLTVIRLGLDHCAATLTTQEIDLYLEHAAQKKTQDLQWYWSGGDISSPELPIGRVTFDEIRRDRMRLLANMKGKRSLFQHHVGNLWRIEFSPKAGFHLHLALFFGGALVDHELLAKEIGAYWVNDITQGRGSFHNCNMRWDKDSPKYGLGVIHRDDRAKRVALMERGLALIHTERQHAIVLPYPVCTMFGSGFGKSKQPKARRTGRNTVAVGLQPGSLAL